MAELIVMMISAASVIVSSLATTVIFLFRENRKLVALLSDCREQVAQMRAELVSLNALIEQAGWSGSISTEAIIVANGEGVIVEWNPGATILLHYTAREMLGKNVTVIIPPVYRDRHDAAMANLRGSDEAPRRGPFQFHAVTKDGIVIPVEVTFSGWKVGITRFVAATLRRRLVQTATTPEANPQA